MRDLCWYDDKKIILEFKNMDKLKSKNPKMYDLVIHSLEFYQEYWNEHEDQKIVIFDF